MNGDATRPWRTLLLDRIEQLTALSMYGSLVYRIWPRDLMFDSLAQTAILASEGIVVLFLLIRRPTADISQRWQDWAVALAGTSAPLLVRPAADPWLPEVGLGLILFGMIVHIGAKLSLNRSFGLVAANRGVKTAGAYRYVRHPMYLGYIISHIGFLTMAPSIVNFALYGACWTLLVLRIFAEERVLIKDAAYREFMRETPYRLIPLVF